MAGGHSPRLTEYVFDTGPLSTFARAHCLGILKDRYTGRAAWTREVEREIQQGRTAYPDLEEILRADWLGEPIVITGPEDLRRIERLRWALGGRHENAQRHRGEAATIVAASLRFAVAVLDDLDARRLAVDQGLPIIGTLGILKGCVTDATLSTDEAWDLSDTMRANGARFPSWLSRDYFAS